MTTLGVLHAWYELPADAWEDCGPPRREKAAPSHTGTEDDYRVLGRPEFGLHPLEDACRRVAAACRRRQQRATLAAENVALYTAREYEKLQRELGYYAKDMLCELWNISRDELADRLALAERVMLGEAA